MSLKYAVVSPEYQRIGINQAKQECMEKIQSSGFSNYDDDGFCPSVFDGIMCWPRTAPNTDAEQRCPQYVNLFLTDSIATKRCTSNGTWYVHSNLSTEWTDYTQCIKEKAYLNLTDDLGSDLKTLEAHLWRLQLIYNCGYGMSLVSLAVALVIMLGIKKLHCPRNTIHVNLFISFMLRAAICFAKDNLFIGGVGLSSDVSRAADGSIIFTNGTHFACKAIMIIFNYALCANYSWIFIEGLYLHMLIFITVFSERRATAWYIALGWGLPLLWMIPWVIVRSMFEDVLCWNTHPNRYYFLIIRIPVSIILVVCFVFFINIVRVLFTKLKAAHSPEAKRYRTLARSTLVLIPLFGVHYIVFLAIPNGINNNLELVKLYFEMTMNSLQGFLVALLFCYLNDEVRTELRKLCFSKNGRDTMPWSTSRQKSTVNTAAFSMTDAARGALDPTQTGEQTEYGLVLESSLSRSKDRKINDTDETQALCSDMKMKKLIST